MKDCFPIHHLRYSIIGVILSALPTGVMVVLWEGMPSVLGSARVQANTTLLAREHPTLLTHKSCETASRSTNFLVIAGGSSPSNNEIALEKNVLYFQRTLDTLGFDPATATLLFANGNHEQPTVRYIDSEGKQQFKAPELPHLQGAATPENFLQWLQISLTERPQQPVFFYFTGHGTPEKLLLWQEQQLTLPELSYLLDEFPPQTSVVLMMAQCYAGSFANFIYEGGDPSNAVSKQTRCGFFATVAGRPSVGCTPQVNEANYQDYSSSFYAGLSGVSRTGEPVASADYNQDGTVSYTEAHAFAKVDEKSTDWPVSTSEFWLQKQVDDEDLEEFLGQPIANLLAVARPEQRYVIEALSEQLGFDVKEPYFRNLTQLALTQIDTEVEEAYLVRLGMELLNVGKEQEIRAQGDPDAIALLDRLLECEAGSWQ